MKKLNKAELKREAIEKLELMNALKKQLREAEKEAKLALVAMEMEEYNMRFRAYCKSLTGALLKEKGIKIYADDYYIIGKKRITKNGITYELVYEATINRAGCMYAPRLRYYKTPHDTEPYRTASKLPKALEKEYDNLVDLCEKFRLTNVTEELNREYDLSCY